MPRFTPNLPAPSACRRWTKLLLRAKDRLLWQAGKLITLESSVRALHVFPQSIFECNQRLPASFGVEGLQDNKRFCRAMIGCLSCFYLPKSSHEEVKKALHSCKNRVSRGQFVDFDCFKGTFKNCMTALHEQLKEKDDFYIIIFWSHFRLYNI